MNEPILYVLLPAFNEETTLPRLLEKIRSLEEEIPFKVKTLVCNDCSSDSTGKALRAFSRKMDLEVLDHKINRGLGETSRDLFERVAELANDYDYIVRMDADDTHSPSFISCMLEKLDQGHDIVIASRFAKGGGQQGVNRYRATISYAANLFMKLFFPIPNVREYSCGFRCYRASLIKKAFKAYGNNFIQLKGLGFTGTLEKLVKLHLLGAKVTEVPFVLRYDLKDSSSKMVSSVTTLGYLIMAILYHWPWGGWRRNYKYLRKKFSQS